MDAFGIKDVIYLVTFSVGIVATFLGTKHNLKNYIRDKVDELKEENNRLKLKIKDLEAKDSLQQQVIDQIGKQMEGLIPKLIDATKRKEL